MREEERVEAEVRLTLNINGEFHVHHHYHHPSSQPGAAEILNAIRDSKEAIMTQLDTSTLNETTDFAKLKDAVDNLAAAFVNLQSQNNTALQAALDAANLDAATQSAILDANDTAINNELAKVQALFPSTGGGNDTGTAGGGTDTTGGGSATGGTGDDTLTGGQGGDTITLSVVSNSTNFPDAVTGQAYTGHLDISGGQAPYSVIADTPAVNGLTMDSSGNVTGTSTTDGTVSFSGTVSDSAQPNAQVPFTVSFNSATPVQQV